MWTAYHQKYWLPLHHIAITRQASVNMPTTNVLIQQKQWITNRTIPTIQTGYHANQKSAHEDAAKHELPSRRISCS